MSLYSTLATSRGSTKRVSFGGCVPVNGLVSRESSSSSFCTRLSSDSLKPEPARPA